MHTIALPMNLFEEDSLRIKSWPLSSSSVYSHSDEEEKQGSEELDATRKLHLLELQVQELQLMLKAESEWEDMCKICFSK